MVKRLLICNITDNSKLQNVWENLTKKESNISSSKLVMVNYILEKKANHIFTKQLDTSDVSN